MDRKTWRGRDLRVVAPARRRVLLGLVATATVSLAGVPALGTTASVTPTATAAETARPFAHTSAWNAPIAAGAAVDPNSAAMVSNLTSAQPVANIYQYGVPVYYANSTTPRYAVDCTRSWGSCELESGTVPIPAEAKASPGTDGAMVVVDPAARKSYEFWQYRFNQGRPTVSWGDTSKIDGDGRDSNAVGAGVSRLAGVVRTHEVRDGVIDHALVFSTRWCEQRTFRFPATKTDGSYTGQGAVPEGARVQLDPAVDVDAIPGITPMEKAVARALQKYGAYNIDCGGASMALIFEGPYGESDPYASRGMVDYSSFPRIPWNRLRVLAPGSSSSPAPAAGTTSPTAPLSAPSNLRSTAATARSVSLAWNPASGPVTRYRVWRGDANWSNWVMVKELPAGTLTYTDAGLAANRTYTYGIRAVTGSGTVSNGSNSIAVRTPAR